jgi:hypothetical protein
VAGGVHSHTVQTVGDRRVMDAGLLVQNIVIALAVLASIAVVMHKQFPNATRRLRIAIALPLLREGRPDWLRAWARRIAPPRSRSRPMRSASIRTTIPRSLPAPW